MFQIKILATGSKGNAYIIQDGSQSILIDPGISIKELRKRSNFGLSRLDFALLSHGHKDHSRAAKDISEMGTPLLMSEGTSNAIGFKDFIIKSEEIIEDKGWKVLPFATVHDAAEPLGFLIGSPSGKKVLFATDTCRIDYQFSGVTYWLVECNYSEKLLQKNDRLDNATKERIRSSHFEFGNVVKFFQAQGLSRTEKIYLIHLSDDNSDEKLFREEIEKVTGKPVYLCNTI